MLAGYGEFEFDLPSALLTQLVEALDHLEPAELSAANVAAIPEAQGVYLLFKDDQLVYVGKTDQEAGLRARLMRHSAKVQHRRGLDPKSVTFKAMRILVFTAVDLEAQLLRHYGGTPNVPWNNSGFGANDPGRNRDTTTYRDNHFDKRFPIDIDIPVQVHFNGRTAYDVLSSLKRTLPYVFRFQEHDDLKASVSDFHSPIFDTARRILLDVLAKLPEGWQATQLPSHIILYKEDAHYSEGIVIARS